VRVVRAEYPVDLVRGERPVVVRDHGDDLA
jgi:hypothetical protein